MEYYVVMKNLYKLRVMISAICSYVKTNKQTGVKEYI